MLPSPQKHPNPPKSEWGEWHKSGLKSHLGHLCLHQPGWDGIMDSGGSLWASPRFPGGEGLCRSWILQGQGLWGGSWPPPDPCTPFPSPEGPWKLPKEKLTRILGSLLSRVCREYKLNREIPWFSLTTLKSSPKPAQGMFLFGSSGLFSGVEREGWLSKKCMTMLKDFCYSQIPELISTDL